MRSIILSLFLISGIIYSYASTEDDLVDVGDVVPNLEFAKKPRQNATFAEFRNDKVIVLVFFATWCGPCNQELPVLNKRILPKYGKNEDFEIMVIGREHTWEELNKYNLQKKFSLKMYPDPERKIYAKFAEKYIPRTYVIDKKGKIVFSNFGSDAKGLSELTSSIKKCLNE